MVTVLKSITINETQNNWVKNNYINLSRFVQDKINEEINKKKKK
jgi:post-segregation antitoxin (ccd killing protein)